MKPSFAIVGCGKVGTAFARFMAEAGYRPEGFASKSPESARRTAELAGSGHFGNVEREFTENADIVLVTTPDGVIGETCAQVAENGGFKAGAVVLHCSGAHPSTVLEPAGKCGAVIGSMHPLQSIASGETPASPFPGIVISVEGDRQAVETARTVAEDLGAVCMEIRTDGKALYHASAVVASNYLVTLLDLAFNLIGKAGIAKKDAYAVLKPLIMGTLNNVEKVGVPKALTGPIARGDAETVERHLKESESKAPELVSLYKTLGLHTLEMAKADGILSDEAYRKLGESLADQSTLSMS